MPTEHEIRELVRHVVDGLGNEPVELASAQSADPHNEDEIESFDLAIGSDHGGYPLKERLGYKLKQDGYAVQDVGTHAPESVDYPDYAHAVAQLVADGTCRAGIIVDGAGIGSAITANKVPGVRAALCYDISSARNSREHNHANVLTLGAGLIGDALAWEIVQEWLNTPFGEGRHARRVDKITQIERSYSREGSG